MTTPCQHFGTYIRIHFHTFLRTFSAHTPPVHHSHPAFTHSQSHAHIHAIITYTYLSIATHTHTHTTYIGCTQRGDGRNGNYAFRVLLCCWPVVGFVRVFCFCYIGDDVHARWREATWNRVWCVCVTVRVCCSVLCEHIFISLVYSCSNPYPW